MGWWHQDEEGHSFCGEMLWGDSVADIMDNAIADITKEFSKEKQRTPTKDELRAGLEFSLGGILDPEEVPA